MQAPSISSPGLFDWRFGALYCSSEAIIETYFERPRIGMIWDERNSVFASSAWLARATVNIFVDWSARCTCRDQGRLCSTQLA